MKKLFCLIMVLLFTHLLFCEGNNMDSYKPMTSFFIEKDLGDIGMVRDSNENTYIVYESNSDIRILTYNQNAFINDITISAVSQNNLSNIELLGLENDEQTFIIFKAFNLETNKFQLCYYEVIQDNSRIISFDLQSHEIFNSKLVQSQLSKGFVFTFIDNGKLFCFDVSSKTFTQLSSDGVFVKNYDAVLVNNIIYGYYVTNDSILTVFNGIRKQELIIVTEECNTNLIVSYLCDVYLKIYQNNITELYKISNSEIVKLNESANKTVYLGLTGTDINLNNKIISDDYYIYYSNDTDVFSISAKEYKLFAIEENKTLIVYKNEYDWGFSFIDSNLPLRETSLVGNDYNFINAFFYDNKFNLVFANNEQIIIYELNNSVFELKKSMNITNIKSVSVIANVFFIENDSDYLVYDFNTDNLLVLNALKLTYTKSVVNNVVLFACVDKQNNLIIFQK